MPFADLADVRIHYALEGADRLPVLVLSNSLGTNLSMWDPQMREFRTRFRVLRYDTRGHGQSSITPGPYTIEQLSKDLIGLLDFLRLGTVHLCGLSMGGMTALWLALYHPERLDKVIFSNTAAKIGTFESWQTRIEAVKSGGLEAIATPTMERWFSTAFRQEQPAAVARIKQMLLGADPEGYLANCGAVRGFDFTEQLDKILCKGLVLSGKLDLATPASDGRWIAERVRSANLVELEAAHLSNIEAASSFNRAVLEFLG